MVPLRIDVIEVCPDRAAAVVRPQLVLQDFTSKVSRRRQLRRNPLNRLENVLALTASAAVLLYVVIGFGVSAFHFVQTSYLPVTSPSMVMISKTVKHGDTLSRFASRYGDPSIYILDREEQITRANHLSGTAPLLPGQHLLIPVTNQTLVAQIVKTYHNTRVASR